MRDDGTYEMHASVCGIEIFVLVCVMHRDGDGGGVHDVCVSVMSFLPERSR
jgi:hypothetical protein